CSLRWSGFSGFAAGRKGRQPGGRRYWAVRVCLLDADVRVKFNPEGGLSPWLSFGGGYVRFLEKKPTDGPSFVPGTNTGTFVFGGGVDTRTVLQVFRIPIGFRAEVRDFYSGSPNYNQPV